MAEITAEDSRPAEIGENKINKRSAITTEAKRLLKVASQPEYDKDPLLTMLNAILEELIAIKNK